MVPAATEDGSAGALNEEEFVEAEEGDFEDAEGEAEAEAEADGEAEANEGDDGEMEEAAAELEPADELTTEAPIEAQ